MGTSDAYGGSPGWSGVQKDTKGWLDALDGSGTGDDGGIPAAGGEGQPDEDMPNDDDESPEGPPPSQNVDLAKALSGVASRLHAAIAASNRGRGSGSSRAGRARSSGGRSGGGRRGKAASSGGTALAGAYGALTGNREAFADHPLSLDELRGLAPFEQAQRIVDAAADLGAFIEDEELRVVNARVVLWALDQDEDTSPVELVREWVCEFVYQAWLTEAGKVLRSGRYNGKNTHEREREVRATIEAASTRVNLPQSGIRANDFTAAITSLLRAISRIFRGMST